MQNRRKNGKIRISFKLARGLVFTLIIVLFSFRENRFLLNDQSFQDSNVQYKIESIDPKIGVNVDILNQKYKSVDAILDWACRNANHYRKSSEEAMKVVQFTSFGPSGLVILHKIEKKKDCHLSIPVITIDTLHLFPESYDFLKLKQKMPNLSVYKPNDYSTREMFDDKFGKDYFKRDPKNYAYLTKQEPTQRALDDFQTDVWITGRRKTQGGNRASLRAFEMDATAMGEKRLKVNPLVDWTYDQVWDYIRAHNIEFNPLYLEGYKSLGDVSTTFKVAPDADERSGRFQGLNQSECGMHNLSFLPNDVSEASSNSTESNPDKQHFLEITSKTIEDVVLNVKNTERDGKDSVFLVFYHPQCSHCKRFEPTFFQVAKELGSFENVLTARFNVGTYRIPQKVQDAGLLVPGTPTLYLVQHRPSFQVQKYNGSRKKDSILNWIHSYTK